MTKQELIDKLNEIQTPDDMEVYVNEGYPGWNLIPASEIKIEDEKIIIS